MAVARRLPTQEFRAAPFQYCGTKILVTIICKRTLTMFKLCSTVDGSIFQNASVPFCTVDMQAWSWLPLELDREVCMIQSLSTQST